MQITLNFFSLPPYFPQGNPDEYVNNDMTQNIHQKYFPKDDRELRRNMTSYLRHIQKTPTKVRAYFRHEAVQYAS